MKAEELSVQYGFLHQRKSRDPLAHKLFQMARPYEEELQKELSQFDEDELRRFLGEKCGSEEFPLYRALDILRQYGNYRRGEEPPPSNAWRKIRADLVDECRATMYAGPMHLAGELDRVFLPLEQDNVDLLHRCFIWLAYGEMPYNLITLVKRNDVDILNRRVSCLEQSFRIYEEAVPLFSKVKDMDAFKVIENKTEAYVDRRYPEMLFSFMERGEYNAEGKCGTMKIKLSQASLATGASLSYSNVRMSGMFYRVFELERCRRIASPEEAFVYFETRGAAGKSSSGRSAGWRTRKDMSARYKAWKQAFAV